MLLLVISTHFTKEGQLAVPRDANAHDTAALLQIDAHAYALCFQIRLAFSFKWTQNNSFREESIRVHEHGTVLGGGHEVEREEQRQSGAEGSDQGEQLWRETNPYQNHAFNILTGRVAFLVAFGIRNRVRVDDGR